MSEEHQESMEDFGAMLDEQMATYRKGFDPGEKVSGTVSHIGPEQIGLDLNAKHEGVIARSELEEADGTLRVEVGDSVTGVFVGMRDGAFLISTTLSGAASQQGLREAVKKDLPVEGVVKAEVNGGFEVTVAGKRAFCPYSQMGLYRKEADEYIGAKLQFMVTEFDEQDRNIVLSRRDLLERERLAQREELVATLAEGDLREGVVTRIAEFGAFVDLGGIDGLIPLHELTWDRKAKTEDVLREGERVTVLVQKIDWDENRISLSLRYAQGDPWEGMSVRYPVGSTVHVVVTRVVAFGGFAELEPGVEGLIHISKLGNGRRLQHAKEVLEEGQELDVQVESVDLEQRRIGLKPIDERMQELSAGNTVAPGSAVTGVVDGHREFGVFVRLNDKQTGLLHISETRLPPGGNPQAKLAQAYPPGSEIQVVVKSIEGQRLSLTLPEVWEEQKDLAEAKASAHMTGKSGGAGLGSLGDALAGLKL